MKLADLDPEWARVAPGGYEQPTNMSEAQGVSFLCPHCFKENQGPVGTHRIMCWSRARGTPNDQLPGPGRWALEGTGFHDLTLGIEPPSTQRSVQVTSGCKAHFYVTHGDITFC